jgi:hypothetical protein
MEDVNAVQTPDTYKAIFKLYQPQVKRKWLTPNFIVYSLWFSIIVFFWLFDSYAKNGNSFESFRKNMAFIAGAVSLYFIIASFFSYEPLNGDLNGKITFTNEGIRINGKLFKLEELSNLDLFFFDYYGRNKLNGRANFNPSHSQRVLNWVSFKDNLTQEQKVYFQLESEEHYKELHPFVNLAIKANKIDYERGKALLGSRPLFL